MNAAFAEIKMHLPSVFSDNMVLQRDTEVAFWGHCTAGQEINITGSWGESVSGRVGEDDLFMLKLKTPGAGGPYIVKVKSGEEEITYKDVLIGEVWLCSGQSNMEMPLTGFMPNDSIFTAAQEIPKAFYKNLRFFNVVKAFTAVPQNNCGGSWSICNPQTASSFSATAFFFGKKLMQELDVPVGLIHTSWGGTPVEAWTSGEFLARTGYYDEYLNKLKGSKNEVETLDKWLNKHKVMPVKNADERIKYYGLKFDDENCASINYNDSEWPEMELPTLWENSNLGVFDGAVWFRKKILIPDSWLNKELTVELGPIDDIDNTYVNGEKIGSYAMDGYYSQDRIYKVPAVLTDKNELTLSVRVIDLRGGGGIYGQPEKLFIHPKDSNEKIPLTGIWKYLPVAELVSAKFYIFGADKMEFLNRPKVSIPLSPTSPTMLYNAMLAPIVPFTIKGAIWYQGESNVQEPDKYKILFPLMIENWRSDWNYDFPFYFTQIAPFNYGAASQSQRLRESQMQALEVKNTGMAVTMDIGNPDNIHPGNKKDVGERLALWALAKDYGKAVDFSGPLYEKIEIENSRAVLSFKYAEGLKLELLDGKSNFQIAGPDEVFHDAQVEIKNNEVIVFSDAVTNPAAVRYCWDNTSEASLFNGAGLPSPSFRTDNWEE